MQANSRWSKSISGGSSNQSISYVNMLGQQYLTQQSEASSVSATAMADSLRYFDGNDRPTTLVAADGSETLDVYDPQTGQQAATVDDVDLDGSYLAGTDRKTIDKPYLGTSDSNSLPSSDSTPAGVDQQSMYSQGNVTDVTTSSNGGLVTTDTSQGQKTTTTTSVPNGPGNGA